jgi:hypothetical protein
MDKREGGEPRRRGRQRDTDGLLCACADRGEDRRRTARDSPEAVWYRTSPCAACMRCEARVVGQSRACEQHTGWKRSGMASRLTGDGTRSTRPRDPHGRTGRGWPRRSIGGVRISQCFACRLSRSRETLLRRMLSSSSQSSSIDGARSYSRFINRGRINCAVNTASGHDASP